MAFKIILNLLPLLVIISSRTYLANDVLLRFNRKNILFDNVRYGLKIRRYYF